MQHILNIYITFLQSYIHIYIIVKFPVWRTVVKVWKVISLVLLYRDVQIKHVVALLVVFLFTQRTLLECLKANELSTADMLPNISLIWWWFAPYTWESNMSSWLIRELENFCRPRHMVDNLIKLDDPYMRWWIVSTSVQIMACRLHAVKPLSKPMPTYAIPEDKLKLNCNQIAYVLVEENAFEHFAILSRPQCVDLTKI